MHLSKTIPDLHYVVVPSRTVFTRCGHLTVFYRHDKDGRKFIYHVISHYGNDGRKTRSNACRIWPRYRAARAINGIAATL